MYSLSFMGKVTFLGKLRLTRVSEAREVLCGSGGNESAESKFHVLPVSCDCFLQSPHADFVFLSLFDVVTDENSESESDTEEKLKGENSE